MLVTSVKTILMFHEMGLEGLFD